MRQTSLQYKVILGYYIISAIALCLSLFTLMELRVVSQRLLSGEQVFVLLNNVLEMRRFEKNFFLYHQQEDMNHLVSYIDSVNHNLTTLTFNAYKNKNEADRLPQYMAEYERLIHIQVADVGKQTQERENQIRTVGKAIVTTAEEIAAMEYIQVHQVLEDHRLVLISGMVVVMGVILLLGRLVTHRILLPLRRIEESMTGVANGQFESIHIQSHDREILSLTAAFNLVLHELRQRHKHLLRSEKLASLGTLLSGVAHELNNPLSNISSSCQILTEEVESDDLEFKRELLSQIDEQTRRARDIVRSLLDFARDREFHRVPISLPLLISEVIRFSKGNIPGSVQVHVDIPQQIVLLGDRQRLQQAFINLLKNAVDAMPVKGEVWIRAAWPQTTNPVEESPQFVGCRCKTPWTEISVQDTGTGIPEEHMARIFDPFFTTKPVGKGSGLGLSVVFEVIEEHDGCIAVESRVGHGTRFIMRLPVQ